MIAVERQPEQPLCIHFVNTVSKHDGSGRNDLLADFPRFLNWAVVAGIVPKTELAHWQKWGTRHRNEAARFLSTAADFREYLYDLFTKSASAKRVASVKLGKLNEIITAPSLQRMLHVHDDKVSESWSCGDGLMGLLRRIALSAADVLLDSSWRTIIECGRDECDWLAVDTSRNHSRRYCSSAGCGNFARVTRHYRRRKAQAASKRQLASP